MKPECKIIQLLPENYHQWDQFVDTSLQGDVFCYSWWLDTITNGNFKILAIFEKEEIVAGIPLAYYLGKINEPPLTRTLGPLFKNLSQLSEHERITIHRTWLNLLLDHINLDEFEQFCTSHNFTDWLPFRWRGLKQDTRYTYLIEYNNKTTVDLSKSLNQNKKRDIAKAEENNISVEISDDFELLYDLIGHTYKRQNLNLNISKNDFRKLDDVLRKKGQRKIFVASTESGQVISAIYIAHNQKTANYLIGGSHSDYRNLGASTIALWEAIKYFQTRVSRFNFCGSNIEKIERYFRGFGGILTPYFHIFTEKPVIHNIERIKKIEVIKEIPVSPPPPPDDWKYHVNLIYQHSWLLVKKALYKIHIRFDESVKVSVITPCYNHGKYIGEMLDSVMRQTFTNFEVIIVNDGSTDDTADILNRISHPKVRIIHTENFGPAHARNLAIHHARGEIIVNLDADNKIAPSLIEKSVAIFKSHTNAGIVYSDLEFIGDRNGPFILPDYSLEEMLVANCIDASACFRKADWAKTEGYSAALKNGYEDFDFWLSILELGRDVYKINEPLTYYRAYEKPEDCRSGRLKQIPNQLEELIVLAFSRHKELYKKVPRLYNEFSEREIQLNKNQAQYSQMPENPVFSIITPTNNRPQLLKRAIESVLSQSFENFEQIIVDDANDPETEILVMGFEDNRLKYVSHKKPSGAGTAYNTGIRHSKGQFINFLDDDDEYLPDILKKIHDAFNTSTDIPDFIFTGVTRVRDIQNGEEPIITQVWPNRFETKEDGLTISTSIGNGYGFSIKRSCIELIGEYDITLTTGQDTDFLIRLSKHFTFCTIPEVLVKIHHHGKPQLTNLSRSELRWNCYGRIMERHFDFLSLYFKVIHIHSLAYLSLCYQLNKKNAGRKFIWRIIKKYPFKKILYQDFYCYELFGTDYRSSNIKGFFQVIKRIKFPIFIRDNKKKYINMPTTQTKDRTINILSVGATQSIFWVELYGNLTYRSKNQVTFTISDEKQFLEEIDCSHGELISYRNIYKNRWDFNLSLFRLLLKFIGDRKNFRSNISMRSELLFLAFKTNFKIRDLRKEIKLLLNRRFFGNKVLRPIFAQYDVVQIQFLSLENIEFAWYIPQTTKLVGSFWGSDVMRKSGIENTFYLEKLLDRVDLFTSNSLEMREMILSKLGRHYFPKFRLTLYSLLYRLYAEIDNTKDISAVRHNFITSLGMDPNKKTLVVGHNGSRYNNHVPILQVLKESDLIDLKDYNVILPITYFPDGPSYKSEIIEAVQDIPNHCVLENLLFGKDLAALRLSTDFLIHALQSDAMSATLIESIYAGAIPIVGSWLPYGNFERYGIPLIKVDDFSEIPDKIVSHTYKHSQVTKDNINKHLRSEHVLDNWIDMYKSLFV